jgi:four helix bundle protein
MMAESNEKGLESLQVWQRALAFAENIYKLVLPSLPGEEKWGLANQLRRSASSIPANIAEGYGRYYYQDSVRFCYIARGSLEETFSHLTLACNLGYVANDKYLPLLAEIQELRRMLNGYIAFLKRSKRGENEPGSTLPIHEDPAPYFSDPDS